MEFEILKEKDMKLLSRKRYTLMIENKGATPSRHDLLKSLSEKFKVKQELIAIKHIYAQYGRSKTKLIVNIYKDIKKMELFEHENLLKKHRKSDKPATEKQQATSETKPPSEAPEEKKEEKKEETKEKQETTEEKSDNKPEAHKKPESE